MRTSSTLLVILGAALLGCTGALDDAKTGVKDGYEEAFRKKFGETCRGERTFGKAQDQVCACLAEELVARVPPKKLAQLTLKPEDPELRKILEASVRACGAELTE